MGKRRRIYDLHVLMSAARRVIGGARPVAGHLLLICDPLGTEYDFVRDSACWSARHSTKVYVLGAASSFLPRVESRREGPFKRRAAPRCSGLSICINFVSPEVVRKRHCLQISVALMGELTKRH